MKSIRRIIVCGLALSVSLVFADAQSESFTDFSTEDTATMLKALELATPYPASSLPQFGTFWSAQHAPGLPEAWPPLPGNNLGLDAWPIGVGNFVLNDTNVDYDAITVAAEAARSSLSGGGFGADDSGPGLPGGGSGDGTNMYSYDGSGYVLPDYGTNLWIAQTSVTNGYFMAIGSNTAAGVSYVIQSVTNLAQAQNGWQYEGMIVGSYVMNWTPFSVTQYNRQNLFIRLASQQSSDGSSIPDWWEQQYGLTNVDPNAQDSAGDGYTIYQKYVLGVNPNIFYTPAAPSGLTVLYSNTTAIVSWLPSSGPVTGYSLALSVDNGEFTTNVSLSASSTSFLLDLSDMEPDVTENDFPDIAVAASLTANFSGGDSTAANGGQPFTAYYEGNGTISLIEGYQNSAIFAFSALPPNTTALQLIRDDTFAEFQYADFSQNTYSDISVVGVTNGLVGIPAAWLASPMDVYGQSQYHWFVQPVNATGAANGHSFDLGVTDTGVFLTPSFYDGRVQLKQNLIFLLRAGIESQFLYSNPANEIVTNPPGYAYSGLYNITYTPGYDPVHGNYDSYQPTLNYYQPFTNNYAYRNFIFSPSDVDPSGRITNGFAVASGAPQPLRLQAPLFQFTLPVTGDTIPLLATNDTKWLVTDLLDANGDGDGLIGLTDTPSGDDGIFTMSTSAQNWFGLPVISTAISFGPTDTGYVNAGSSTTISGGDVGGYVYPEVAQPQFQTVEYDFWNPTQYPQYGYSGITNLDAFPIPGIPGFSTTNGSAQIITAVGSTIQVAGYAKLQVMNSSYPDVYGYLGQYFDQAYRADSNGIATTNITGVLSPYGSFYATEPGAAALVTMPDVDSGIQGTGIVECISLNVDKNHDGTMELSISGPDATSEYSPMEFWVNNGNDQPNTSTGGGLDYDSPVPPAAPNSAPAQFFPLGHISCPRDLENFARLWICGLPALGNNYQVTLGWQNVVGSPAINLYNSVETNGGTGYLTDTNIAADQCLGFNVSSDYGVLDLKGPGIAIASITPSSSFTFPANSLTNVGNQYFIFEGAGIGSGELTMTLTDSNSNSLAQTGVWLDLHDIKDFYEGMRITNSYSFIISNWGSSIESIRQASANLLGTDTNMLVWVHGINVPYWNWLDAGDTILKRLYWAGYGGKFMAAGWPCRMGFQTIDFNDSELHAYKASFGLTNYFAQLRDRFPGYRLNVLAHSQGNAIVGEAVREGAILDTYILTEGAMGTGCYDVNYTNYALAASQESYIHTPQSQPMGYLGIYTNFTGRLVNFYNFYDPVLDIWLLNQITLKPNNLFFNGGDYQYDGTNSYHFYENGPTLLVTDPEESRAMVSRALTLPIGQSAPTTQHGVIQSGVDMHLSYGFYNAMPDDHSSQWTWPIQRALPYYQEVLLEIQPIP